MKLWRSSWHQNDVAVRLLSRGSCAVPALQSCPKISRVELQWEAWLSFGIYRVIHFLWPWSLTPEMKGFLDEYRSPSDFVCRLCRVLRLLNAANRYLIITRDGYEPWPLKRSVTTTTMTTSHSVILPFNIFLLLFCCSCDWRPTLRCMEYQFTSVQKNKKTDTYIVSHKDSVCVRACACVSVCWFFCVTSVSACSPTISTLRCFFLRTTTHHPVYECNHNFLNPSRNIDRDLFQNRYDPLAYGVLSLSWGRYLNLSGHKPRHRLCRFFFSVVREVCAAERPYQRNIQWSCFTESFEKRLYHPAVW